MLGLRPDEYLDVSAYPYSRQPVTSSRHEERLGKQHADLALRFGLQAQPTGAGVGAGAAKPKTPEQEEMNHRPTSPATNTTAPGY